MNTLFSLKTFRLVGFFYVCLLIISCTDELSDAGLEISPSNQVFIYHDSVTHLNSYSTLPLDLIHINKSNLLLGYLVDPRLGVFQNNFMAEVTTLENKPVLGVNPVADSIVLFLKFVSAYGDTVTPQTFAVYELNKELELENIDTTLNSDANVNQYYDEDKYLGSYTFIPKDTITIFRFKLPQSLAEHLLDSNNVQYYDTVPYFNWKVFRGIYLMAKPLPNGGSTCTFSYADSTFIELFYHNDKDTLSFPYKINATTTKCNIYNRGFNSDIHFTPYQTIPDPSLQQELCYIKSNYGSDTRIDITNLKTWADSGYFAINKAYLTVFANYEDTIEEKAFPPTNLGIYRLDVNDFKKYNISDYYDANTGSSGTIPYDTATNAYYIRLTQQLFNTIQSGSDTLSIVLTATNTLTSANRVILNGAIHPEKPIKLKITYTKFN